MLKREGEEQTNVVGEKLVIVSQSAGQMKGWDRLGVSVSEALNRKREGTTTSGLSDLICSDTEFWLRDRLAFELPWMWPLDARKETAV